MCTGSTTQYASGIGGAERRLQPAGGKPAEGPDSVNSQGRR